MTVEQSSIFFIGSILTMLGFIVVVAGIVIINNIIHRYWKPVRIFTLDSWNVNPPPQFIEQADHKDTK